MMSPALKLPKRALRFWGLASHEALQFVATNMQGFGFAGPTRFIEGAMVSYGSKDLYAGAAVTVWASTFSGRDGYAPFDCGVTLFSRTLHDLQASGPSNSSQKGLYAVMTPCLTIRLSHLLWCEAETSANPSWLMTLDPTSAGMNAQALIDDFRRLLLPLLDGLRSDDDLERLLADCLDRNNKPRWVLSDRPWFARMEHFVSLLRSRTKCVSSTTGSRTCEHGQEPV